ncbi:MAG: hypothetical protein JO001_08725 [Alphaproteobacteria bacterium]|nr:hypothetical protein [Alphaproteobacteria bacterium]
MASPGSQYIFYAPGQAVNLVPSANGNNLPQGNPADFNIVLVTNPNGTSYSIPYGQGYQSAALLPGGTGQSVQLLAGNYGISDTGTNDAITLLSTGAQTINGAHGDTLTGGAGNDLLNAISGQQLVIAGTGANTVYGGAGDTINGTSGTVYIDGTAGSMQITGGVGQSTIFGGAGDTITGTGGSGASTVFGAQNDTIIGGSGADLINAAAGKQFITGGAGQSTIFGGAGDTIIGGAGNNYVDGTAGNMSIAMGSGGADTIIGSTSAASGTPADTLTGGAAAALIEGLGKGDIVNFAAQSGNATINATAGNNLVTLGSGPATVYGGVGDTINLGSGNQYVDGTLGGQRIAAGTSGGFDILIGSLARTGSAGVDTLTGGAAQAQIQGLGAGDLVNFAAQTNNATINATAGGNAITMGGGNATIYAGVGDAIALGSGSQYVDGTRGSANVQIGSGSGFDIFIGSTAPVTGAGADTVFGGSAQAQIQALGKGDVVSFANQTGNASINATAGNNLVTLGAGNASVYAGTGDTVNLGSVSQYVDGRGGGATGPGGVGTLINLGSGGTDNIIGSTVAGAAGDTINGGGGASLNYNPGSGNDVINLTGSRGSATINGLGADTGAVNDTITASNGGDSVFGGQGDRIGVGVGAAGTDLFTHATSINGASIGFGSNDSVAAVTYGATAGAVTVNAALPGASAAQVTVTGFSEMGGTPTDYLFYQNETAGLNSAIVATSSQISVNGVASTQMTLPDGTVMTLVGVPQADFNTSFFKT